MDLGVKETRTWILTKRRKYMEQESDGDTNCNWCTRNRSQRFSEKRGKRMGDRQGN